MLHQAGSSASDEFDDSNESLQSSDLDKEHKDFMAEQEAFDSVAASIMTKLKDHHGAESSCRRSKSKLYIFRDHEHAHEELVSQYFSEFPIYTDLMFRTRFWMRKSLFLHIVTALGAWSPISHKGQMPLTEKDCRH
jgi:hypothetical protein